AFAGAIVDIVRRVGLKGTACARWRVDTIRSRLFKLAGRVTKTVRRIRLSLASAFPLQDVFARTLVNLRAAAQAPPG
ncbi:MAG: transposase, partial [Deltaproteobacteria bacterium]|nr:transposase [Deltaproteobacteria bacterium]